MGHILTFLQSGLDPHLALSTDLDCSKFFFLRPLASHSLVKVFVHDVHGVSHIVQPVHLLVPQPSLSGLHTLPFNPI